MNSNLQPINQVERLVTCGGSHTATIYEDLPALPARYEPLFSRASSISMFLTLQWYQNFVQTVLAPSERLRIYALDMAQGPGAAVILVMRHDNSSAGWLSPRTLSGLSNYYSSLFGPVIEPGESDPQHMLDTVAAAIASDELRWDVIDLHPLAVESPVFPGLIAAFKNAGLLVQTYFCFGNWYLPVGGRTYAEYFATLPSKLRHTITRKKKQLENSAKSRIVVYRDEAGLDDGLRAYEQIYTASWKIQEPFPEFIRGLCRVCAKEGWLRLGIVYVEEQPAAAQVWIVNAGIANIYKLAYDERYAKLSAGTVLTAHLMEHVIDVDKVREVDYLTGDDAYKKDWMSDRRERRGIIAFNLRTPRGLLAASRHLGGRAAKRGLEFVRRHSMSGA